MMFMVVEIFPQSGCQGDLSPLGQKGTHDAGWIEVRRQLGGGRPRPLFPADGTDDITLLQRWVACWSDLIAFDIVPAVEGKDTARALSGD
jgi:Domain of unknown function (DUF3303)